MSYSTNFRFTRSAKFICLTLLAISLVLQGCGFTLKSSTQLPQSVSSMTLHSSERHAPLARLLKKQLTNQGVKLHKLSEQNQGVTLFLGPENVDRKLRSLFATGQVAEYELTYLVPYQIHGLTAEPQELTVTITREYQDDPDAVLAKSRELELILSEMRIEAGQRIMTNLAQLSRTEN